MLTLDFFNASKNKRYLCLSYSEKMKLFRAYAYDLLETHYLNLGFSQQDENEDHMKILSRISANEVMCKLDYPDCVENANEYYEDSWIPFGPIPGEKIPADIIDVVLNTGIRTTGDPQRWFSLEEKFKTTTTVDSIKKKYLVALARTENTFNIKR
jgi:hypothetical protein